jgi:hypothetical protein
LFIALHLMAIRNEILRRRVARLTMVAATRRDAFAPPIAAEARP